MSGAAGPRCQLCGAELDPGSLLERHLIPETCIKALRIRLETLEDALRAFLPGSDAPAQPVEAGTCDACQRPFARRRRWARFCSTACRHRAHTEKRAAAAREPAG